MRECQPVAVRSAGRMWLSGHRADANCKWFPDRPSLARFWFSAEEPGGALGRSARTASNGYRTRVSRVHREPSTWPCRIGARAFPALSFPCPISYRKLDQGSYPIQSDERLSRLQRRQHVGRVNPQLVETHVVKAEIRGRRMQRTKRAVAEELLQPRGLEDAVRAADRQRRAGDAAYRLADHVFRPVERGGRFRRRPFLVAEPGRTVGD